MVVKYSDHLHFQANVILLFIKMITVEDNHSLSSVGMKLQLILVYYSTIAVFLGQYDDLRTREVQYCTLKVAKSSH